MPVLGSLLYIGNFNSRQLISKETFMLGCLVSDETKPNLMSVLYKQLLVYFNCIMALPGLSLSIFLMSEVG
jgi:hypothetical protein